MALALAFFGALFGCLFAAGAFAEPLVRTRPVQLEHRYQNLYWSVVRHHGRRTPGRNIVSRGMKTHGRVRPASRREIARSIRTFKRWLAPPAPRVGIGDRAVTAGGRPSSPAYQGGRWAIPSSIVMCESRGNYHAVNPQSGAYGAYQILPSTASAYGCDLATPQGQDVCASRIWAGQGRGAWVC